MSYANQFVRFERAGDKVTPVRVRKEWVSTQRGRKFKTVRLTEVGFGKVDHGPDDWRSCPPTPAATRDSLRAAGVLRPLGEGQPCLTMGSPSEWSAMVAANPYSPYDPYGIGTEAA